MIVNVSQLSIGFDAPMVDCIVLARPTLSPALFVQMVGRSLRKFDKPKSLYEKYLYERYEAVQSYTSIIGQDYDI